MDAFIVVPSSSSPLPNHRHQRLFLFLLGILLLLSVVCSHGSDLHPIVLVPGYTNSLILARLTESYVPPEPRCGELKNKGWFPLYPNSTALQYSSCFAHYESEVYDPVVGDYFNVPGVETRVPYFGSPRGFPYMAPLVQRLEAAGYREGRTLFGVPYDFRYVAGPPEHPTRVGSTFLRRFKKLVERASKKNGGRPVIIMSHSFGGVQAHQLLIRRPLPWRRRYVKRFISLAMGWGGNVVAMQFLINGSLPGSSAFNRASRTQQVTLSLLPMRKTYGDTPLLTTERKNYSVANMPEFLADVGLAAAIRPYEKLTLPVAGELPPPLVPVTLVNAIGTETQERVIYVGGGGDLFKATPRSVYTDGDGRLPEVVMRAIKSAWTGAPGQEVKNVWIANVTHDGLVADAVALERVISEVNEVNYSV